MKTLLTSDHPQRWSRTRVGWARQSRDQVWVAGGAFVRGVMTLAFWLAALLVNQLAGVPGLILYALLVLGGILFIQLPAQRRVGGRWDPLTDPANHRRRALLMATARNDG